MNELTSAARATNWGRLKALVLDSVSSPITKRVYSLGLDGFCEWFGREPRSGFDKATVSAWRAEHVYAGAERPIELANQLMGFRQAAAAPLVLFLLALFSFAAFGQSVNEQTREIPDHAVGDFQQGRIEQSVDGFDRVAKLVPRYAPQLWQRGIALYYAGRYQDCRAQFESHRTVNPDDVENALRQVTEAAGDRFSAAGYMHGVS